MTEIIATREAPEIVPERAPLTSLAAIQSAGEVVAARGVRTRAFFSDASRELLALTSSAAAFDCGARVRLLITGGDRVRWLNGMVTNTVKTLAAGAHNYSFVLNAQGRIQGDATIFAFEDHLVLETDRGQAEHLFAHLDHFIIMDDVELAWIEGETTLGLAGPDAPALLAALGLPVPSEDAFAPSASQNTPALIVVREWSPLVPRFSLWIREAHAEALWQQLLAGGAEAAGGSSVNALRVLEGTPLYGVDITEKTLAQETGQTRALNFTKGCYLGQEIVERVRSRANVHRGIRRFALHGSPAAPGTALLAADAGAPIGELTSVAAVILPSFAGQLALATVRLEALERGAQLSYAGGTAEVVAAPPLAASNQASTTS